MYVTIILTAIHNTFAILRVHHYSVMPGGGIYVYMGITYSVTHAGTLPYANT